MRHVTPATWRQVALAAMPGLLLTLAAALPDMPIPLILGAIIVLGGAGIWLAAREHELAAFPVWALVPLGMALFMVLMAIGALFLGLETQTAFILAAAGLLSSVVWVTRRAKPGRPPAISWALAAFGVAAYLLGGVLLGGDGLEGVLDSWLLLALPAAAGLLLAPTHGLPAALILLPLGTFIMSFDVEHVIYFPDAPAWSDAIRIATQLLLMVLLPVWVLRARTQAGQAVGLVAPLVVYYALLVVGLAAASAIAPDWSHVLGVARPVLRLLAVLAVCGAVYLWLWRGESEMEKGDPTYFSDDAG